MRPIRLLLTSLLLATASLAVAPHAAAQGWCGFLNRGSFDARATPSAAVFPQPQASHFLAGQITLPNPVSVTVDPKPLLGNGIWYLCVRTPAAHLGHGKPLQDLEFYNNLTNAWQAIGNEYTLIGVGIGGLPQTFTLPLRMALDWSRDVPGTYGPTPLEFRVSQ